MEALPAQVLSAHDDLAEGNIDRAESTIRAFLQQHGIHGEGMRVMALVAAKREVLEVAEELLAQVLRRAPEHVAARSEYVSVLIRLQGMPTPYRMRSRCCARIRSGATIVCFTPKRWPD